MRLQNSVKLSLLRFLVIFFALAKSDIIACAIVILKPCGFSDILFALKARDAHCVSREYHSAYDEYNCVSNITRREANRTGVILR